MEKVKNKSEDSMQGEREDALRLQQLKQDKEQARLLALTDGSQTCSNLLSGVRVIT